MNEITFCYTMTEIIIAIIINVIIISYIFCTSNKYYNSPKRTNKKYSKFSEGPWEGSGHV
jgi:uncharacterized membrane protein